MSDLTFADSVIVGASPDELYDLVSDVTQMGRWSPECRECWWEDGASPQVGAWFGGRNERGERVWETRSQIAVADRGREFAYVVGGKYVRWSYTFEPVDGGTKLTETWEFLPDGLAFFREKYGDEADAQIEIRASSAKNGIPKTLAAIKSSVESG